MQLRESGAVWGQFLLEAKTGLAAGPGAEAAAEAKPSGLARGAGPGEGSALREGRAARRSGHVPAPGLAICHSCLIDLFSRDTSDLT